MDSYKEYVTCKGSVSCKAANYLFFSLLQIAEDQNNNSVWREEAPVVICGRENGDSVLAYQPSGQDTNHCIAG